MNRKKKIQYEQLSDIVKELLDVFTVVTISMNTVQQALSVARTYKYSYFDSLMIASALENKCTILFSEDMHHGQLVEDALIIKNPFKDKANAR
jgi:predicted nucleic acid-binding protein